MELDKINIHINYSKGKPDSVISGFAEALAGQEINYHSHHPETGPALLARADKSCNKISWKSVPVQQDKNGMLTFVCLAAIAGSKGGNHRFTLLVEDKEYLEFYTSAEGELPFDKIHGKDGTELRFEHVISDSFNDHFGYLYVTLPFSDDFPDAGLTFSIVAEDAQSEDWFMLFKYPLSPLPKISTEPVLKNINGVSAQVIKIVYDNIFGNCSIKLQSELETIQADNLKPGANVFRLGVQAVQKPTEAKAQYYINNELIRQEILLLNPVTPRCVYILPFSHNDIGYTDLQANVLNKQCANIDIALMEKQHTLSYPVEAQARWNLEVIWALENWWENASAEQKKKFIQAVKSGHIGLNALHNNLLSGLCHAAELAHHLDFARKFTAETGLSIDTAAVTDIPGFVWGLVKALSDAGVRYFAMAPNNGDRVGHIYDLADQPFYWASPSGQEKVLAWIFGAGYALFHREKISGHGIRKALEYVQKLQDSIYPYDFVPLAYTISGDNGTPDSGLPDFVKNWNSQYTSPRFIISTHARFFHDFEAKFGKGIPVLKGDLTPYWEDGAASSALETKLNRNAADLLQVVEKLYKQFYPEQYPTDAFYHAWQKVIFFDEHTWGAWNSTSAPDLPEVKAQWEYKRQFALDADKLSRQLLDDLLQIDPSVIYRINQNNQYEKVPRNGTKTAPIFSTVQNNQVRQIENNWVRLVFNENGCSTCSLWHKGWQRELLSPGINLAQYFYMQGKDRDHLFTVTERTAAYIKSGQNFDEVILQGKAEGVNRLETTFRIYHTDHRLEIRLTIDKIAIRNPESVHLAFPFSLPDGILRYDGAGVLIEPEKDQLPGACKNFFCPTGVVDISNPDCGISIVLIDNPLIEIGGITAELPWLRTFEPSTVFYAYLMNNYWHTNYKADQSGEVTFRFIIDFHDSFNPEQIILFSRLVREEINLP